MANIYEHLKDGNMLTMMEKCKKYYIHHDECNIKHMLIAAHTFIFTDVLAYLNNYITPHCIIDMFGMLLQTDDCYVKINMAYLFFKKHNRSYYLEQHVWVLIECAIKNARFHSIKELITIHVSNSGLDELLRLLQCINVLSLPIFIYIVKQCDIEEHVHDNIIKILHVMVAGYSVEIVKYILLRYRKYLKKFGYFQYSIENTFNDMMKYYYNLGVLDNVHNV